MDFSFLHMTEADEERGVWICPASSFHAVPASLAQTIFVTGIKNEEMMRHVKKTLLRCFQKASPMLLIDEESGRAEKTAVGVLRFSQPGQRLCVKAVPEECIRAEAMPFDMERLIGIMRALRDPSGCPWDRAQDHETLRTYLIQEAYEVADAIDHHDMVNLKEELGDVLYQIVFHARIAEENGCFTMQDVIDGISDKMVQRHPHVFGETTAEEAAEILRGWELRKMKEKKRKHLLAGLSVSLPSLLFACIMQKKVSSICMKNVEKAEDIKRCFEVSWEKAVKAAEAGSTSAEKELCFGQALFAAVHLIRLFEVDPELSLHRFNRLYAEQLGKLEDCIQEDGRSITEAAPELREKLEEWLKARGAY